MIPLNHLILYCSLLLGHSIFPSIRVFSNELALCIRWPSIGVSASPTNGFPLNLEQIPIQCFIMAFKASSDPPPHPPAVLYPPPAESSPALAWSSQLPQGLCTCKPLPQPSFHGYFLHIIQPQLECSLLTDDSCQGSQPLPPVILSSIALIVKTLSSNTISFMSLPIYSLSPTRMWALPGQGWGLPCLSVDFTV